MRVAPRDVECSRPVARRLRAGTRRAALVGADVLDRDRRAAGNVGVELQRVAAIASPSRPRPTQCRQRRAHRRVDRRDRRRTARHTPRLHDVRGDQAAQPGPLRVAGANDLHSPCRKVSEGRGAEVQLVGLTARDRELTRPRGARDQHGEEHAQHPRGGDDTDGRGPMHARSPLWCRDSWSVELPRATGRRRRGLLRLRRACLRRRLAGGAR